MSTKGNSGSSMDAKREEFRKYLEKEGVLEYLTKQLVRLASFLEKSVILRWGFSVLFLECILLFCSYMHRYKFLLF